jgi:hypothetical protein
MNVLSRNIGLRVDVKITSTIVEPAVVEPAVVPVVEPVIEPDVVPTTENPWKKVPSSKKWADADSSSDGSVSTITHDNIVLCWFGMKCRDMDNGLCKHVHRPKKCDKHCPENGQVCVYTTEKFFGRLEYLCLPENFALKKKLMDDHLKTYSH